VDCGFFLELQAGDYDELANAAYDVAHFWNTDPENMMTRPLSVFLEIVQQSTRINTRKSKNG
jgi:hypothetical protein